MTWLSFRGSLRDHSNWTNFEEVFKHMTPWEEEETGAAFDKCMTDVQTRLIYTILNCILPAISGKNNKQFLFQNLKASRVAKRVTDTLKSPPPAAPGVVFGSQG